MKRGIYIIPLLLVIAFGLHGQYPGKMDLELSEGMKITICRRIALDEENPVYYYLPVNLRISEENGRPEFSFLAYRQDSLSPVEGGLLHMLMTWGLTKDQMREADSRLIAHTDSTAFFAGSVFLEPDEEHPSLEIISDKPLAKLLRRSLKSMARTPLFAGSKLAVSFSFSAEDALLMAEALKEPKQFKGIKFRIYFSLNNRVFRGNLPSALWIESDFGQWLKQLK